MALGASASRLIYSTLTQQHIRFPEGTSDSSVTLEHGFTKSVIATIAGRVVCASMGIELVEANAENATMVGDAVASLLVRNVEAI